MQIFVGTNDTSHMSHEIPGKHDLFGKTVLFQSSFFYPQGDDDIIFALMMAGAEIVYENTSRGDSRSVTPDSDFVCSSAYGLMTRQEWDNQTINNDGLHGSYSHLLMANLSKITGGITAYKSVKIPVIKDDLNSIEKRAMKAFKREKLEEQKSKLKGKGPRGRWGKVE